MLTDDQTSQVWDEMIAAKVRSLYFADLGAKVHEVQANHHWRLLLFLFGCRGGDDRKVTRVGTHRFVALHGNCHSVFNGSRTGQKSGNDVEAALRLESNGSGLSAALEPLV
jgi:hypothetical protein